MVRFCVWFLFQRVLFVCLFILVCTLVAFAEYTVISSFFCVVADLRQKKVLRVLGKLVLDREYVFLMCDCSEPETNLGNSNHFVCFYWFMVYKTSQRERTKYCHKIVRIKTNKNSPMTFSKMTFSCSFFGYGNKCDGRNLCNLTQGTAEKDPFI